MLNTGREMIKWYTWIIFITLGIFARDVPYQAVEVELQECYDNITLHVKDNRLPHTLNTFIALIRKIEDANPNMDLQTLTIGILHRFRQDGIIENPNVPRQPGVSPYAPYIDQAAKFARILPFISQRQSSDAFPSYDLLTGIERCTLHFMLSDTIDIFERGDEGVVCKVRSNTYRRGRRANSNRSKEKFKIHDVETLTPEQIDIITNHKDAVTEDTIDPNALYPELPPNHPKIARVSLPPYSNCPVENGIVKTDWGPVSIGSVIAGIAAGLEPQTVPLTEVFPRDVEKRPQLKGLSLNNKWFATITGDLAEVALVQAPTGEKLQIGVSGNWNSSSVPRWYFLTRNDSLEFTTAEIRGDIDGLILANEVESLYTKVPRLRLSQILEMYYGPRGLFDFSIRACNRGALFTTMSSNASQMMSDQAYSASMVLKEDLQIATLDDRAMQGFAKAAADELSANAVSLLSKDLSCRDTESKDEFKDTVEISTDLTIILDTTWPFGEINPILMNLLVRVKINRYNSQYTIMNGGDGSLIVNTTESILDYNSNMSHYKNNNVSAGFNFAKSLEVLESMQRKKLDEERSGLGKEKSDIVLVIPYASTVPESDKDYCMQQIRKMREQVPDATILVLAYREVNTWLDYVESSNDLFSTGVGDEKEDGALPTVLKLISRIRQIPQRLINTKCGSDYSNSDASTNSFNSYIEPKTASYYRMHPNYFHSSDTSRRSSIEIEPSVSSVLRVCMSRQSINVDSPDGVDCVQISEKTYTYPFSCNGAEYIHSCQPLYMAIYANNTVGSYPCTEPDFCKFSNMIKYTVRYDNLLCTSSASINVLNTILLIISIIYVFS